LAAAAGRRPSWPCVEDPRLAHELDHHDRHQADDGRDLDQRESQKSRMASIATATGPDVELGVVDDAGQDEEKAM